MKIASITISGFRCFGVEPTTINFDSLTVYVGPNSSGKTAAMMGLSRLFGESPMQRRVISSDFHLQPNEQLKDQDTRTLYIECRLDFPELESDPPEDGNAIPESFNQMIVDSPGGTPYCRIRLEAIWTNDGTLQGDIEQKLDWILTESNDASVVKGNRRRLVSTDRAKIRVLYVPATRDPNQQIRGTTATVFNNLLKSLDWGATEEAIRGQLVDIQGQVSSLSGMQTLNSQLQENWKQIYLGRIARNVKFQGIEEDPTALLDKLGATFDPDEDGRIITIDALSDGLRSLFSLSLSLSLFHVEQKIIADLATHGFAPEVADRLPLLTVFAVEEPENHLSPHYLGHVVTQLNKVAETRSAQVILSSHSPSILGRVMPDIVRYFRGDEHSRATSVIPIPLPQNEDDEAFKFVREAVRGYPELYFSSLIILGEGPSEEIVLRHVFDASNTPLDSSFISIVPLGGRHVNHFWRLLHGLRIPYLTLLDLDMEKEDAGWGRIQYVRKQLIALHGVDSQAIQFKDRNGNIGSLANTSFDNIESVEADVLQSWMNHLQENHRVFFSKPLDLDLSLLEAFPEIYKGLGPVRKPYQPIVFRYR